MRLIDADKLKLDLRTSNDCQNCPYNGQSLCRKSCPVNEFADLVDKQETVEPTFGLFRTMLCETCQAYATNRAIVKLADEYTRPHGEWQEPFESNGKTYHKCTHCHISSELILFGNFCPNCGADMRGGEDNR